MLSLKSNLSEVYSIKSPTEILINQSANGYRLPTEAEWKYACRSISGKVRYGEIEEIAWYEKNANGSTQPVGLKSPNEWGLYDMLGNVWDRSINFLIIISAIYLKLKNKIY